MRAGTLPVKDVMMGRRRLKKTYLYLRRADKTRVVLLISVCFLLIVLVFLFGYLFIQDIALSGHVFPGVTVDSNAVGGMTRDQARAVVSQAIAAKISGPLVISYKDNDFKLNPTGIGVTVDVDKMVEEAMNKGSRQNIIARMWRRFMNKPINANIAVILKYDQAALKDFVGDVASTLDYAARNASVDMSKGYPVLTTEKNGRSVKQSELTAAIVSALPRGTHNLAVPVEILKPKVTEGDIGTIVVIKQSEHKLYQYQGEKLADTYAVAVGQPKYPTPTGRFEILEKKKDPWWYPPKSDWAKDKKPIPPGPGNPLGPYWMDLGNGFGIHSTPDEASLGYSASHGCVRMSEWGAQQLFKVVEKGTPVYIVP